jgi:hypothetical protein
LHKPRRSDHEVTDMVDISSPEAVCTEVCRILAKRYPGVDLDPVHQAFETFTRLYAGLLPGFHGCDTWYHDAQHSLDCTLAMMRLVDGHDRTVPKPERFGDRRAVLGVICALFHDSGYIRRWSERHFQKGAQFTLYHVSRSGDFLAEFLPTVGFRREADLARRIVHYTGYEMALDKIPVRGRKSRRLGFLLGTADLLSQLSDRCYPEKCLRFLYHEFATCGLAGPVIPGVQKPMYASPEDLMRKTPGFVRKLFAERLDGYFQGARKYMEAHFRKPDPYVAQIEKHLAYITKVLEANDLKLLRRRPRSVNGRRLRQIMGIRLQGSRHSHNDPLLPLYRSYARRVAGKKRIARYMPA